MHECSRNSSQYKYSKLRVSIKLFIKKPPLRQQRLHCTQSRPVSCTPKVTFATNFCCYIWAYLQGVSSFCKDNFNKNNQVREVKPYKHFPETKPTTLIKTIQKNALSRANFTKQFPLKMRIHEANSKKLTSDTVKLMRSI